jgi:serine/threonine-protein kinase
VLPPQLAAREELRERFLREARTAAQLSHPHVVPIFRVGEAEGIVYFAMAYVAGETLGERLRARGPLAPREAARVLREVAWALAYAHGRGIVHRDVKPDNIMLEAETGRALVTDFGIARHEVDPSTTDPGRIMGTAHFMSPEQAAGAPLDGRSDLYALGVVGWLALAGRLPFEGLQGPALLVRQAQGPAPSLASAAPHLPSALVSAIDRCLARDPADRFPSGEMLAEALGEEATARAALPAPLRLWLHQRDPFRVVYPFWTALFGSGAIFAEVKGDDPTTAIAFRVVMGMLALLPLKPSLIFHAMKARRVLRAGYGLSDLRLVLRDWQAEQREDAQFVEQELGLGDRLVRASAWLASGFFATSLGLANWGGGDRFEIVAAISGLVAAALAASSAAMGVPMLPRRLREGRVRAAFWNSRAGAWAARVLTPKRRAHAPALANQPTELALGAALGELYAALPKPYRAQLRELPDVVERLEARAAAIRSRIEELERLASHAPELGEAREAARGELATVVASLETIRLDLLRLHGGARDLAPLTTVIEDARRLGEAVDRLAEAQREVANGLREPRRERPGARVATPA